MVLKLSNENISELTIDEIDIGLQKSFEVKITQKLIQSDFLRAPEKWTPLFWASL